MQKAFKILENNNNILYEIITLVGSHVPSLLYYVKQWESTAYFKFTKWRLAV